METASYSGLVGMQEPPCVLTKRVKEPLLCLGKSWYSFFLFFSLHLPVLYFFSLYFFTVTVIILINVLFNKKVLVSQSRHLSIYLQLKPPPPPPRSAWVQGAGKLLFPLYKWCVSFSTQSEHFKTTSQKVARKYWWKNIKMIAIICVIAVIILILIILLATGVIPS